MERTLTMVYRFVRKAGAKLGSSVEQLATEITNRKYSRSVFSGCYQSLGEVSETLDSFGEFLHQIQELGVRLNSSIETVFLQPLQEFLQKVGFSLG